FPRSTKSGGAWMDDFRSQYVDKDGEDVRPIVVNVGNFAKPSAPGESALLTLDDVETMFHEFGHALHSLLSKCTYPSVSGTSVSRDFVEFLSQFNENWAFDPEVMKSYARHYETGEPIPDELIEKIGNASKFNQGFKTTELAAASILDMKWHELTTLEMPADCQYAKNGTIDPVAFDDYVDAEMGLPEEIAPRYHSTYFNHVFGGGYEAGYYSYLWSEVLARDAFEVYRQKGVFDRLTASSFRRNILEKGDTEDPMKLYRRFRGADPTPDALLRTRGLEPEE
ncbi:MAG: M3 family metallopeptidase, partial [Bacteroidales bacterium]|nr:M3 family metallopeptidase [Bacteroidales bacterium]